MMDQTAIAAVMIILLILIFWEELNG